MGSMGLHRVEGYVSRQAAVGGNPRKARYLELYISAKLDAAASIVRKAAVEAGGLVAVARNPIEAEYAKEHGASGALRKTYEVGKVINELISSGDVREACYSALKKSQGTVIDECTISEVILETRGGFDVGTVMLCCSGTKYLIRFINEYITLEKNSERVATFSDLITLINLRNSPSSNVCRAT